MHVLSLPPAFVLSQDQTLKLRIQSRHNHVVVLLELNGRSYTLKTPQGRNPTAPRALVLPFQKRDRRSLFHEPIKVRKPFPIRATSAAHVSLSHLQLSNNRQTFRSVTSLNDQSIKPKSPQNLPHKSLKLFCLRPPSRRKVKKLQSEFVGRQQRRRPRWCAVYRSADELSSTASVRKSS